MTARWLNSNRNKIRLALPSKGRMEDETREFLRECGLPVNKVNPRQYIATIAEIPNLEVWFQRSADVVRKVRDGDVDLGIVGYDNVAEYRGSSDSVVIIHDALGYGHCRLSVAVPEEWSDVNSVENLASLATSRGQENRPLRLVSKYQRQTAAFLGKHRVEPYHIFYADGALEAAPHMGTADFIVDLVSSGVTLRENRLKEIEGGEILASQMVFIGNRAALIAPSGALEMAYELLERFEAHLRATEHYTVIANMRGDSPQAVARKVFEQPDLGGLQGPTISRVYLREETNGWHAVSIVVRKDRLRQSIEQIRAIGGSGVLVMPVTYIFEETPWRWRKLLKVLGLEDRSSPAEKKQ